MRLTAAMSISRQTSSSRRHVIWAARVACIVALAGCGSSGLPAATSHTVGTGQVLTPATGIHKIKHVVIIMQENRSFDSYFGTYPGADGFARTADGKFTEALGV